jgi:hypothetical protein
MFAPRLADSPIKSPAGSDRRPVMKSSLARAHQSDVTPLGQWQTLQRNLGNQAVQRLMQQSAFGVPSAGTVDRSLASLPLQRKLLVGSINDPLEHEADRIADTVARVPSATPCTDCAPEQISRKCAACEEEESAKALQTKRTASAQPAAREAPSIVHEVLRSPGQSLDAATQGFMEARFGRDFSGVRVHADARAVQSAHAVNAAAYTVGRHVVFGAGQFAPHTASGRRLMAHELTHVVQQGATPTPRSAGRIAESEPAADAPAEPMLMRTPLLSSTMKICKRVLKGEHDFHVSDGDLVVTANASWGPSSEWEGEERPQCGREAYHISLTAKGFWGSEYGTCEFETGAPFSRQWKDLPEDDYYLVIWTNNTNPNCCLEGDVEVTQHKGLSGESCTRPPPGPLEILHTALNIAGLVPALGAIPDAINAGIYLVEGDWVNAGISAIAIVPIFGGSASVVLRGEKTVVTVSGEVIEKVGQKEISTGLKDARAAQATKVAAESRAAAARIAGAEEIKLSKEEYEAALKLVFPSQYVNEVARLVDGVGERAAARAMQNPRFVAAMNGGNWTLAGTFFHTAAKDEARAIAKSALPKGWTIEAERTIQSGAGGSRADILLHGPGGELVEFDWKTTGKSALSSGSRQEMVRHAGQIRTNIAGTLSTQQSRSWMDYVRPLL